MTVAQTVTQVIIDKDSGGFDVLGFLSNFGGIVLGAVLGILGAIWFEGLKRRRATTEKVEYALRNALQDHEQVATVFREVEEVEFSFAANRLGLLRSRVTDYGRSLDIINDLVRIDSRKLDKTVARALKNLYYSLERQIDHVEQGAPQEANAKFRTLLTEQGSILRAAIDEIQRSLEKSAIPQALSGRSIPYSEPAKKDLKKWAKRGEGG